MKNKIFVLVAVVLALGVFGFFLAQSKKEVAVDAAAPVAAATPGSASSTPEPVSMERFIRPHSASMGNTMARVVVVEWFDPECESCKIMHPVFKKIVEDYKSRVHFVLRYMPYHNNSLYAACALEEAKEFGKFNQALDLLFEKQAEWGDHKNPKPELIATYLASLGIPKEKLGKDYVVKKHAAKIQMDEADGNMVGVRGTPSYFVNGRMVPQLGDMPIRSAIDQALKAQ